MKALAICALVALVVCTSGSRRSHNSLVRNRRAETVTRAETDSVICIMTECNQQFQSLVENVKAVFESSQSINEAKLTQTCDNYKGLARCMNNLDCTVSPGMKDAFDMLAIISFVCDNHKAAFVKYGPCILNALKGDGIKHGCEHLGKASDFQSLMPTGQRSRRQAADREMLGAVITPGLMKIKEGARKIPAIDCATLTVMDLCIKDRVQYKCNEDGSGDAAELAEALYKEGIGRLLKGVEGLLPDRSDITDTEACFAGSSFRFWFW